MSVKHSPHRTLLLPNRDGITGQAEAEVRRQRARLLSSRRFMESHCEPLIPQGADPVELLATGPSSGAKTNMNQAGRGQDRRAEYALTLQKACNTALMRVKNNNVVANSNWASPLAAAPSAISTMAILLKAADQKAAAGLEIESQEVKDEAGNVQGTLPSKYFHTNLQHCSDVGRLAFLDAQHGMMDIRAKAMSMIAEEGTMTYIMDLLEDPEDARFNLKPEIKAVKVTAKKCLQDAEQLTGKFQYWHLVIIHLKQTSLSKRGQVIKQQEDTSAMKSDAEAEEIRIHQTNKALEKKIESMEKDLLRAAKDFDRAQAEVDRLRDAPLVPEPDALGEINRVKRLFADIPVPTKQRGWLAMGKDAIFGQSDADAAEDEAIRVAYEKKIQKLTDDAMAEAKKRRDHQRQIATDRLNDARETERKLDSEIKSAVQELSTTEYKLAEAKGNLAKTQAELERLGSKETELTDIMAILDESTRKLGKLKEQIEPLVEFFHVILRDIHNNVEENLEAFLRPIVQGITEGEGQDEVEAIRISRRSKERILTTALQMQGRFSAIADISSAYITISEQYIRPAINKMETLSTASPSEWQLRSKEFFEWCETSMKDINGIAESTKSEVDRNLTNRMNALQRRAIEAADENFKGN